MWVGLLSVWFVPWVYTNWQWFSSKTNMLSKLYIIVVEMDNVLRIPELYEAVRALTISRSSGMNHALNGFEDVMEERSIDAKAVIAYLNGVPVGWALLSSDPATGHYNFTSNKSLCFQVFVNPIYRRMGIGSKLLSKATEVADEQEMKVYESDAPSFFRLHRSEGKKVFNIYG